MVRASASWWCSWHLAERLHTLFLIVQCVQDTPRLGVRVAAGGTNLALLNTSKLLREMTWVLLQDTVLNEHIVIYFAVVVLASDICSRLWAYARWSLIHHLMRIHVLRKERKPWTTCMRTVMAYDWTCRSLGVVVHNTVHVDSLCFLSLLGFVAFRGHMLLRLGAV